MSGPSGTIDLSQIQQFLDSLNGSSKTPTASGSPTFQTDANGITSYWNGSAWVPISAALQKYLSGGGSTSAASVASAYHLDPRELALEYAKLNEALNAQQMSDLKDLITNRNTESVDLANAYTNAAKNAADFAANPRDAVADLMYRKAAGLNGQQATPFGSIGSSTFGQYGNALADKFQAMFGPDAQALQRAGEFVGSIPPSEYLNPPTVSGPTGGGSSGGGSGGGTTAGVNPPPPYNPPAPQAPGGQQGAGPLGAPGPVPGMATGGTMNIGDPSRFGGYQPSSSEGGTNMNIHEQAFIVGKSGHVYATIAENGYPEQVKITPTAAGKAAAQQAAKSQNGVRKFGTGGDITFGTDPSQFMDQLRQAFNLRGIRSTGALPDPRLLAGTAGQDLLDDPDFNSYTQAGYSALGISPQELKYTIDRFTPAGIRPELPKITY